MKYTQFIAFEKHLESAKEVQLSPLYCLIGKDLSERRWAFDCLKKILFEKTPSLEYLEYDQEHSFLNDIEAHSLFASTRLLLFTSNDKYSKKWSEAFEKKIVEIPPSTTLVLLFDTLAKSTTLYKAIEKQGIIFEMGEEKPWEKDKTLSTWLMNQAARFKKQISTDVVTMLVKGCNRSFSLLANEWEKLLVYVGERPSITIEDVRAIATLIPEDNSWAIGEAILGGNIAEAVQAFRHALAQGQSILPLLRQIRHQFITALHLLYYKTSGQEELIHSKYPYLKGPMLSKQLTIASKYGMSDLERAIVHIDCAEFNAKDGWEDPQLIMTYLIGKLCR